MSLLLGFSVPIKDCKHIEGVLGLYGLSRSDLFQGEIDHYLDVYRSSNGIQVGTTVFPFDLRVDQEHLEEAIILMQLGFDRDTMFAMFGDKK